MHGSPRVILTICGIVTSFAFYVPFLDPSEPVESSSASSSKRRNHLVVKKIHRLRLSMIRWHASLPLTK